MVLLSKDNLREELQRFSQESFREQLQGMEQRLKDAFSAHVQDIIESKPYKSVGASMGVTSSKVGSSMATSKFDSEARSRIKGHSSMRSSSKQRSTDYAPSLSDHFDEKDKKEKTLTWMTRARKCSMHDDGPVKSYESSRRRSGGSLTTMAPDSFQWKTEGSIDKLTSEALMRDDVSFGRSSIMSQTSPSYSSFSGQAESGSIPRDSRAISEPLSPINEEDKSARGRASHTGMISLLPIEDQLARSMTDDSQDESEALLSEESALSLWQEEARKNPQMRHTLHHPRLNKQSVLLEATASFRHSFDGDEHTIVEDLIEFLSSSRFVMISGSAIVLNIFMIGIETDYMARHWESRPPIVFRALDTLFCMYFLIEILLRIVAYGAYFFCSWWNMFDLITVVLQLGEEVTSHLSENALLHLHGTLAQGHVGVVRVMRIFRLIRVMRFIRILSAFSALRMLVVSIIDSLRSLVWTLVLIFLAMFITSVYFTQIVTDHKLKHMGDRQLDEDDNLLIFYGTLDRTMLTLYQTISEGLHWDVAMEPLRSHCSPWMALVFSLYIAFVTFAMLNVITGVFVESAIQTANDDKKKVLMYQMRQLFLEADVDNSGTISWEEFKEQLENPQLQSFLRVVDLDKQEAEDLFRLLDVNGEDEISADEFVHGALRIHGFAKAIDLATFMHDYHRHARRVERGLDVIYGQVKTMQTNDY